MPRPVVLYVRHVEAINRIVGRLDYAAIGGVPNLAARLSAAADGKILLDAATAARVGESTPSAPLGALPIKGFATPLAVFAVVDAA